LDLWNCAWLPAQAPSVNPKSAIRNPKSRPLATLKFDALRVLLRLYPCDFFNYWKPKR
jgi:hypothetical protein